MLVYYFVPFIVSNRYLLFWVSNGHNSVTVQNRTHVSMNFFDHKDLVNHLLQLCPEVVKHPVYCKNYTRTLQCQVNQFNIILLRRLRTSTCCLQLFLPNSCMNLPTFIYPHSNIQRREHTLNLLVTMFAPASHQLQPPQNWSIFSPVFLKVGSSKPKDFAKACVWL